MANAQAQAALEEAPGSEPQTRSRRRLRNLLVDSGLQLRLASYLVAVATALSLGLGWLLWRAYRETSQVLALSDPSMGAGLETALARVDSLRIVGVAVALIVVLACLLGAAVVVTHRIAGPAYALGLACRRIAEGDLSQPRPLRSGDLLQDLGGEVDSMVQALRGREAGERDLVAAAATTLRDPLASAHARQDLARHLETLAAEKKRRLGP